MEGEILKQEKMGKISFVIAILCVEDKMRENKKKDKMKWRMENIVF